MKLENSFSVPVSVDETWRVLLDIERVAPCVPGATLTSHDGDSFSGKVKVKLGPIGLTYAGTATFLSRDEAAKVAVIEASGRETRGAGTAKAVVTCRLVDTGGATEVFVETDLAITGKPAQFGRGVLADVTATLIGQFAANLANEFSASAGSTTESAGSRDAPAVAAATPAPRETDLASHPAGPPGPPGPPAANGTAPAATNDGAPSVSARPSTATGAPRQTAEPIDLLAAAGGGVGGVLVKRAGPAIAVTALLVAGLILWRRLT